MIDYDKLKEAHDLCRKYSKQVKVAHHITVLFYAYDKPVNYGLHKYYDEFHEQYTDIDMLIATLKELTNPEPKYHDSQLVWFIDGWNQVTSKVVMRSWRSTDISTSERYWVYDLSMDRPLFESQLFPTRQALIEHQISYWQNLSEPVEKVEQSQYVPDCSTCNDIDECQHSFNDSGGHFKMNKCIKCGEFFI